MIQIRRAIKKIAFLIIATFILGIVYNALFIEAFDTPGFRGFIIKSTFYTSVFMGLMIALFEIFLFKRRIVKLPFGIALLFRSLSYLAIIIISILVSKAVVVALDTQTSFISIIHSRYMLQYILSREFLIAIPYFFLSFLFFNFTWQVSEIVGQGVFVDMMLGKYFQPKEEELIFMFVDLKSSTTIAERMGNIDYHKLLNRFFYDISEPVNDSKGEIYQYVGDEVVIFWKREKGIKNANCIRCFYKIDEAVHKDRKKYIKQYGFVPEFKAGLHAGKAVVGEIGMVKKDIVYHGDVVNTASRIQKKCNDYDKRLLISNVLLEQIVLPEFLKAEKIGDIILRGKETPVELYSLETKPEAVEKVD